MSNPGVEGFTIDIRFRGRVRVEDAEAWIATHCKGRTNMEFLGVGFAADPQTGMEQRVMTVRFTFGRKEEAMAFREYYVMGKPMPAISTTTSKAQRKSAEKAKQEALRAAAAAATTGPPQARPLTPKAPAAASTDPRTPRNPVEAAQRRRSAGWAW